MPMQTITVVPTDKEGMLQILNGNTDFEVIKTWKLTPRGALTECANGE
ncbi:MAG: hypothetical protein ACSLE8_06285 [Rhodococcus sp. (in: high G+C Gram-positive bacteria)]